MKKFLMFLMFISSLSVFAQVPFEQAPIENEDETVSQEDSFEAESFLQNQEEYVYPPSENSEDYIAEEEVYDSDSDYND